MNFIRILVFISCSLAYGSPLCNTQDPSAAEAGNNLLTVLEHLPGNWIEDPSRRDNLDEFLAANDVSSIIRTLAANAPWTGERTVKVEGNVVDITGKAGPNLPGIYDPTFSYHLVADNTTVTKIDLKIVNKKVIVEAYVQSKALAR